MKGKLKEFLFQISEKTMFEQEVILRETFENWKGVRKQTDDVSIIGIKV